MDGTRGLDRQAINVRALRVAVVTETYLPEVNGVAMTMGQLVRGLCARGHCIELVRPRQRPAEVPAQRPHFEELLVRGVPIPQYDALKIGLPAKSLLLRHWSTRRPDIVHLVTEGPLGWSALTAALALGLPVALFVSRLAPEKNLLTVLETFEAMRQTDPRVKLVVVGDGPERARVQGRYPDAIFTGARYGGDLAAHYASADIFLFPSLTETYGNVTERGRHVDRRQSRA